MKRKKNVDFVRKSEKTNCYLEDVNWPNIEESFSVTNTYLGIGSPEFATVGVSDKYFKMNDYFGVNTVANSTEFILGQSTILTSVLSTNKHWLNINEAVTVSNTYLGVGTPQLATVNASDKYFNSNVSPSVISVANPTDLILGQSTIRTSVLSDNKNWINLNESVSPANTFWGVGSPQLGTIGASDKFFNMNPYAGLISVANSTDLTLGQSTISPSLLSANKHRLNLNESVSVANTFWGIGSLELATIEAVDKYSNRSVYFGVNHLPSTTHFISGKSTISPSLVGAVSVSNTSFGIGSFELSNFNAVDKYSNRSVYSGVNHLASTTDFILGKSTISPTLLSDKNQLSSIEGSNYFGSDNKIVGSLNIGHLKRQLAKNSYLTNSRSAIKEYDVINIDTDFLKIENKDLKRYIKKECQKFAEIVKIDPNHIGIEISGTSQNPNINISFVFTGSVTSNNLQIGDKNITIVNYGK